MGKPVKHYGRWRIRWTDGHGLRKSEVYDSHQEAEYQLRLRQVEAEGHRRGTTAFLPEKSFNDIVQYWLSRRAIHKRSYKDDVSILRRHLCPAFDGIPLNRIDVENIDRYQETKTSLSRKTVHNHLTLLISMLNLAKDLCWISSVPRIRKPTINHLSTEYRYLRTDDEVSRFLLAAKTEGECVFALYSTAIYTGMRAGELAALKWEDIDLQRRLITVARSFHGPTKNGELRYVPILDPLVPILTKWKTINLNDTVFPSQAGTMLQPSARVFQECLHRVLQQAGFARRPISEKRKHFLVFHDLRHTFASLWVSRNGDIFKLQKILGHKSIAITMRYSHLHPDTFSDDYSILGVRPHVEQASVLGLHVSK